MNLVETYINSQPSQTETHKTVTASSLSQTEVLNTVTASRPSEIKAKRTVTISNGWWFKFKKRNPSISLKSGDSTAGVRINAVNSENINDCFD